MESGAKVSIGRITGTFGYKGEVKVMPLTDFPERYKKMSGVFLSGAQVAGYFDIESVRVSNHQYLFKFKGIDSKEQAQNFFKAELLIDEKDIYPLPEGYYYHFQLQGLEVYDQEIGFLGILTQVLETGANDVYEIKTEKYGDVLIPAIQDVVLEINLRANRMDIRLLPGLIG